MEVTLVTNGGSHMGLKKVLPKDLEFGKCYLSVAKIIDDYTGEVEYIEDFMWCTESKVIKPDGSGQIAKSLVFLKAQHRTLFSQLGTPCTFWGPLTAIVDTEVKDKREAKQEKEKAEEAKQEKEEVKVSKLTCTDPLDRFQDC